MCTLDVLTVTGAKKLDWHTMCINNRTRFRDGDLPEEPCVGVRCVTGRQCINGADGLGVGRAVRVGKKPCTAWVSIPAWGVTPAQFKCARVTSCVTVPVYGITHRACGLNNSVDGDQKRAGVLRGHSITQNKQLHTLGVEPSVEGPSQRSLNPPASPAASACFAWELFLQRSTRPSPTLTSNFAECAGVQEFRM